MAKTFTGSGDPQNEFMRIYAKSLARQGFTHKEIRDRVADKFHLPKLARSTVSRWLNDEPKRAKSAPKPDLEPEPELVIPDPPPVKRRRGRPKKYPSTALVIVEAVPSADGGGSGGDDGGGTFYEGKWEDPTPPNPLGTIKLVARFDDRTVQHREYQALLNYSASIFSYLFELANKETEMKSRLSILRLMLINLPKAQEQFRHYLSTEFVSTIEEDDTWGDEMREHAASVAQDIREAEEMLKEVESELEDADLPPLDDSEELPDGE